MKRFFHKNVLLISAVAVVFSCSFFSGVSNLKATSFDSLLECSQKYQGQCKEKKISNTNITRKACEQTVALFIPGFTQDPDSNYSYYWKSTGFDCDTDHFCCQPVQVFLDKKGDPLGSDVCCEFISSSVIGEDGKATCMMAPNRICKMTPGATIFSNRTCSGTKCVASQNSATPEKKGCCLRQVVLSASPPIITNDCKNYVEQSECTGSGFTWSFNQICSLTGQTCVNETVDDNTDSDTSASSSSDTGSSVGSNNGATSVQQGSGRLGGLDTTAGQAGYVEKDLLKIGSNAINIVLSFVGVLFLIMMIAGGTIWMTAAGNEDRVKVAIKLIAAGVIGLVIVVSAYAITSFVGTNLAI